VKKVSRSSGTRIVRQYPHVHSEGQWVRIFSPLRNFLDSHDQYSESKRLGVWLASWEMAGFSSLVNIGC